MPHIVQISLAALTSILACLLFIPLMGDWAARIGLVDRPTARKQHLGEIPIVGGISIFFSVSLAVSLASPAFLTIAPILIGSILVLVGALDDKFSLSPLLRLPVQIAVALAMIYIGGNEIKSIGNLAGTGPVLLSGALSIGFTIACTVGVINSINMIDGVDGLSGSVAGLTLLPLIYYSGIAGDLGAVTLLVSLLAAIVAFLYFNARIFRNKATVFLGDSGSMFLGLILAWYLIRLTQGDEITLSAVAAGWIFGLPLVDTVSVVTGRLFNKRSPLGADRSHFHHRLLDVGFSVNQTVVAMVITHSVFILLGVLCNTYPKWEPAFFWAFVLFVIIFFFFSQRIINLLVKPSISESTTSAYASKIGAE